MNTKNESSNSLPLYKKVLMIGIMVAVVFFCIPELQRWIFDLIGANKPERRELK